MLISLYFYQLELVERERKYYREQNRGNFEGVPACALACLSALHV